MNTVGEGFYTRLKKKVDQVLCVCIQVFKEKKNMFEIIQRKDLNS